MYSLLNIRLQVKFPCLLGTSCGNRFQFVDGLFRQPGGISQSLLNVFWLQVGIVLDDLIRRHPISYQVQDQRDSDAHPPNEALPPMLIL